MNNAATRAPRTVLVTGAAGFIGSALCPTLLAAGHRVVAYDDLSRGRQEYLPPAVVLVKGDIRDRARVCAAIAETKPDCVVHLAGMHFIPDCHARPAETLDVNVEGTRHVVESCRGSSVRNVIFASSAAVYAPSDRPCVEDTTPIKPVEIYGESKLAGEQVVAEFHRDTGVSVSIMRLFNAVGRRETNPHVIPHIFESLRASNVISLGNTAPRRDYIDTRDVAEAILAVSDRPDGFRILNVGTGFGSSVDDIVDALRRILRRPIEVVREPARMRATERMLLLADIGKIRAETRWMPRIALQETLEDLVRAYRL